MFSTWGSVAYRFRRVIPVIVIALVALLYGVLGTQLDDRMSQEGWDDPGSESTRAAQIEQDIFGRDDSGDVIVLVTADRPGVVDSPAVRDSMTRQLTGLAADHPDQISHVVSYFERAQKEMITPDGTSAFAAVGLRGVDQDVLRNFRAVEDDLRAIHVDGATVEIGGATAVADALDLGYTLLDSAYNYENEGTVGEGIRRSGVDRDRVTVTSKLPGRYQEHDDALVTVQESLYRTGLDHIDLYLIHWPLPGQGETRITSSGRL